MQKKAEPDNYGTVHSNLIQPLGHMEYVILEESYVRFYHHAIAMHTPIQYNSGALSATTVYTKPQRLVEPPRATAQTAAVVEAVSAPAASSGRAVAIVVGLPSPPLRK